MKFTLSLIFGLLCFFSLINAIQPRNPEPEVTGAPGELTCEKSGCHSGGRFVGTVNISGVPDTVLPSTKYSITLTHKSNAVVTGFELTALDPLNKKCGVLSNGSGTSLVTGPTLGRQYIRHSNSMILVDSTASWTFAWTSPATLTGDTIKFYFASLCGSNSNGEKGDNAIKNSRTVFFKRTTAVSNIDLTKLNVYPNPSSEYIIVNADLHKDLQLSFYSVEGRLVKFQNAKSNEKVFINDLEAGTYSLLIQSGKSAAIKSILKL